MLKKLVKVLEEDHHSVETAAQALFNSAATEIVNRLKFAVLSDGDQTRVTLHCTHGEAEKEALRLIKEGRYVEIAEVTRG